MIDLETVRDFVYENFPMVKLTKGGTHFNARCILCGDSKKSLSKRRFNLDWNNGNPIWQCFNCGRSGSFVPLYAEINGIDPKQAKAEIFSHSPALFNKRMKDPWKKKRREVPREPLTEYHNYILRSCIGPTDSAQSYITKQLKKALKDFIVDRHLPEHVKIYAAHEGRYRNRLIIPIYDGDKIVYFQGRRIHKNIEPKYLNPIAEKEQIILNKEKFDSDKYIIVTEGLIDAFMIPNQGTASLGSSVSEKFLNELDKLTDKGIIIFFDNDDAGEKAFAKFTDPKFENIFRDKVKYFLFPDKYKRQDCTDLNEIVTNDDIEDVYSFIVDNSYTYGELSAMDQSDWKYYKGAARTQESEGRIVKNEID